ncbi:MAG: hypothetical protein ACMZ66_11440 [Thalassospira sp.]|uniref:hypothetical protein n=1 Tax=Thalassospira sp. TaxID=1912094 RepID=UPI003A8623DE
MTQSHPIIRIHGIKGAQSACRVLGDRRFDLLSPEHAGMTHGAQWLTDLVRITRAEFSDAQFAAILDCRGRVSSALAAIENGLDGIIVDALPRDQRERLGDMARQMNCQVMTEAPSANTVYGMDDHRLPDHELDRRLLAQLGNWS